MVFLCDKLSHHLSWVWRYNVMGHWLLYQSRCSFVALQVHVNNDTIRQHRSLFALPSAHGWTWMHAQISPTELDWGLFTQTVMLMTPLSLTSLSGFNTLIHLETELLQPVGLKIPTPLNWTSNALAKKSSFENVKSCKSRSEFEVFVRLTQTKISQSMYHIDNFWTCPVQNSFRLIIFCTLPKNVLMRRWYVPRWHLCVNLSKDSVNIQDYHAMFVFDCDGKVTAFSLRRNAWRLTNLAPSAHVTSPLLNEMLILYSRRHAFMVSPHSFKGSTRSCSFIRRRSFQLNPPLEKTNMHNPQPDSAFRFNCILQEFSAFVKTFSIKY